MEVILQIFYTEGYDPANKMYGIKTTKVIDLLSGCFGLIFKHMPVYCTPCGYAQLKLLFWPIKT